MSPRVPRRTLWLAGATAWLVTACRTPTPPVTSHVPTTRPAATTAAPAPVGRGAFVVIAYTETLVIPLDPALAVETLPGHWVGALPGSPSAAFGIMPIELVTTSDPALPSLPVCPSGDHYGACALVLDPDEPSKHEALASATGLLEAKAEVARDGALVWSFVDPRRQQPCTCAVVHDLSTDGPALDLADPDVKEAMAMTPYDEEEYLQECAAEPEPDLEATAVLGGVLYRNGLLHTGLCSGLNLYYGAHDSLPLRPGATELALEFPAPVGCQLDAPFGEVDLVALASGGFACEPEADQMLAYALRHGRLLRITGSTAGPESTDCSCASALPVSPAVCPSPLDPCGTGTGLASREGWDALWVTTDERFALATDAEGLAVLAAGRKAPIRREDEVRAILGVEHHPDTALLGLPEPPEAVRVVIPPRHASDAGFEGSAKAWGNRCFAHLQAERLDAAEAACFAGLLEGGTKGTRGALTYNLGRIAEARGDRETARAYYQRSQGLRPHDATAERLRALGGS